MNTIETTTIATKDNYRLLKYHIQKSTLDASPVFYRDHTNIAEALAKFEFKVYSQYYSYCKIRNIVPYDIACYNDYMSTQKH